MTGNRSYLVTTVRAEKEWSMIGA
jgi:hypothetical protein